MKKIILASMAITLAACGTSQEKIETKPYPVSKLDSTVVDNYHGTEVADPYRWLEDDNANDTKEWVKAQNDVTYDYLNQIPFREQMKTRLTELFDYPKVGTPNKVGDYYFQFKNNGLQNQSVMYYQKGKDGKQEIFLDPNTLSADGTVALAALSYSKDDKYCAYALSAAGSDWVEIHIMEIATKKKLPEVIKWVKFSGANWGKDGFYYSRYQEPKGSALTTKNEFQKVYFHTVGTDQKNDKLVYEDTKHPLRYFSGFADEDTNWEFINGSEGTYGTELLFRKARSNDKFKTLFEGFKFEYSIIDVKDNWAYISTNEGAENNKVIKVNLNNPKTQVDVIAETENLLQRVSTAGGNLFLAYLEDATSRIYQYDYNGKLVRQIELPGIGTAGGFSGEKTDTEVFYSFSSFNIPSTSYTYDIATGESKLFYRTEVDFNGDDYVVNQKFYASKDGTKVPMFIVHKKGLKMDGQNPTYLYAYGGFSIPLTPGFSPTRIAFLEQGGVYVIANIRGGSEYGEKWHKGGMKENKQNVFDDFIGAAEYLIAEKYTSPEKLAIAGGSNGGLLVGACLTQRPDLYAVALPAVGVLDMLRYHKFTIGWGWVVEYGSSDVKEEFEYIYKYSPLHNVKKGTCYPATMITTADHDDRVVPAHSFKFAAELQAAQSCDNPTLIRIETNAGHGAGKPTSKVIDEQTDIWSFVLWNTNSKYTPVTK